MSGLAVVIPALNEERAIRAVVNAALAQCDRVIVVDDGSADATSERVADLPVALIRHETPQGKAQALRDGFRRAVELGADAVLTMDGDGQHDAADIPRLVAAAGKYPNRIVIGARLRGRERQPGARRFGNNAADWWVAWVCGRRIADTQSGQRYYPLAALQLALALPREGFAFESEILIEAAEHGIDFVSVPIASRYEPGARASHFRPFRDVARITRMIAWRLIRGGLMPLRFRRALRSVPLVFDPDETLP